MKNETVNKVQLTGSAAKPGSTKRIALSALSTLTMLTAGVSSWAAPSGPITQVWGFSCVAETNPKLVLEIGYLPKNSNSSNEISVIKKEKVLGTLKLQEKVLAMEVGEQEKWYTRAGLLWSFDFLKPLGSMSMQMKTTSFPGHCYPGGRAPCNDISNTTYTLFADQLNPTQVFNCTNTQVHIPSGIQ